MKLCLGVGPLPIHPQHLDIMEPLSEWTLVDKYVNDPRIKNWDATSLTEIEDGSCETIYASHLLEHFPHTMVPLILRHWFTKLAPQGELIINVPDLEWAAKQLIKYEDGFLLNGYYNTIAGEHGVLSIIYGSESHEGEFHKGGFTKNYLAKLLEEAGFFEVDIQVEFDAHDMMVLIARGYKK